MPRNFESLPDLIQHIGAEKSTHYGKSFKVVSKSDPSNAAYTTLPLGLHLDMPIYKYKPGVRNRIKYDPPLYFYPVSGQECIL